MLPLDKIEIMRFCLLAVLFFPSLFFAQEKRIVPIETFPINATVLTTLQGMDDRAVLRVDKVEPNPHDINIGDTLLFTFYWSILPVKSKLANFPGVGSGDEISVHIAVKSSPFNGSPQYTAYHYKNRSRSMTATKAE